MSEVSDNKIRWHPKHILHTLRPILNLQMGHFVAFAIFSYFSGWHYANEYFSNFDINRSSYLFGDYNTFIHSFSVVASLPEMVWHLEPGTISGIILIVTILVVSSIKFGEQIPEAWGHLVRWIVVVLGTVCVFQFSVGAGRMDARQILSGAAARSVEVTFTDGFERGDGLGELMDSWEDLDALALIWRNSNETLLLVYHTDGQWRGCAAEIYRIPNQFIASIKSTLRPTLAGSKQRNVCP